MTGARRRVAVVLLVATVAAAMAGCGRVEPLPAPHPPRAVAPSDSELPDGETSAGPDDPAATPEPADSTGANPEPAGPMPTGPQPGAVASPCAGRTTGAQVIAALRRDRNLLPATVTPTVTTGPLCAGSWQYTVMSVPGREALQVVTRGDPGTLTVVTAGTYVCVPEVAGAAPGGILAAAHCR